MHRDSKGKSKREGHVLPRELVSKATKRCIEGNTFDIVKKAEADERAREAKSTQVCKDKARINKVKCWNYRANMGKYKITRNVEDK